MDSRICEVGTIFFCMLLLLAFSVTYLSPGVFLSAFSLTSLVCHKEEKICFRTTSTERFERKIMVKSKRRERQEGNQKGMREEEWTGSGR